MTGAVTQALQRWVTLCARRPWLVVALCLSLGAIAGAGARGLTFRGDFAELLPESTDEVKDLRFVEERAGGVGYLVVQVTGGDAPARQRFAEQLAPALEARSDLVRYVEWQFDVEFFRQRALLLLPAEKLTALHDDLAARIDYERKHANPLFVDLLEEAPPATLEVIEARYAPKTVLRDSLGSKDGAELYLFVKPRGSVTDLHFDRRLIAAVREEVEVVKRRGSPVSVALTGSYVVRVEEDDLMKADLSRASLASVFLGLGLILLATRRPSALAVVLLPVLVGVAFTFLAARLGIGHLNPITGFLAAVLVGLGIEYGVHLTLRFKEERAALDLLPALEATVLGTWKGALTSALTNAAAFLALLAAQFAAFRQFGALAAIGVMVTVVATYAMGPAVLVLAERMNLLRASRATEPSVPRPRAQPAAAWRWWAIVIGVLSFAGWSLFVSSEVGFETDMRRLRGKSQSTDLNMHVSEQLGIIMNPALLHVQTLEDARAVRELALAVRAEGGEATSIDRVASVDDLVPHDVGARLAAIEKLQALFDDLPGSLKKGEGAERLEKVRELLEVKPWSVEDLPLEIRRRFTALSGGGWLVLVFPRYQSFDTRQTDLWADELTRIVERARAAGISAHLLDGNRIASRILRLVRGDGPPVMLGAAVAVFLMIWLSLRRLKDAALVAGPLYLGMVCLVGVMHAFGLKLNFFNIVLLPNLLSIAVDNSVHLFHRYREEGPGSLGHVVRTTGYAAAVATLSNAAGYGTLLLARHTGLQSIAWLAIAGVACTFVGTTILFPALLALLEEKMSVR